MGLKIEDAIMSFEIFIQCFESGGPAGVPRQQFLDLLEGQACSDGEDSWLLTYSEGSSCEICLGKLESDSNMVESAVVYRPVADPKFWDTLFAILQLGNVVIYFPATCPPVVAKPSVIKHLPASMIESLGQPICVHSGAEIVQNVRMG